VLEGPYSDEEIDAAVAALTSPDRLAGAQDAVARFAPQLQRILDDALDAGGWFGQAHEAEVSKAATAADVADRQQAVRALVAEETRLGMMVGVAVGIELARELAKHPHHKED
jgi:hypothetical protein